MATSAHSTVERLAAAAPTGRAGKAVAIGALALAAAAVWNNVRARKAENDYPPMGRFVEINGARVHYLERCSTVSPRIIAWSRSIGPVTGCIVMHIICTRCL